MNYTQKIFGIITILFLMTTAACMAQSDISVSGMVKDKGTSQAMPYVNVALKNESDSALVNGTITNEEGLFVISKIKPGKYILEVSFTGYLINRQALYIGSLNTFYDLGIINMAEAANILEEVEITAKQDEVAGKMDKKTFSIENSISQSGGSLLQVIQNIPGVTTQDGKLQVRGSDKVIVLIDGKQTALTGFGNQSSLDNIPASAIEKIEIINNPSAKYDANGNAGIINIIYKKNKQEGFNGKVGMSGGLGALWIKKGNLPGIRPQYQYTPKLNPSLSLNYRKNKLNAFLQGDYLLTHTLNKNEFVDRYYDSGEIIRQQTKRNRNTTVATAKAGVDWNPDDHNQFSFSALFSSEHILDHGDEPFYNADLSERLRLWQFLEDELKTTVTASGSYSHKFKQPGHLVNIGLNYTFHREDERYTFTNILPSYTGLDAFKLLSDEHVTDFNFDYVKPLKFGRVEGGVKFRYRDIPTNMQFIPGFNSPLDTNAGGWANYKETIPAVYGNYVLENKKFEMEAGLRVEYVGVNYQVNPEHSTYKSNGYNYTQPFPNLRLAYKLNDHNKLSAFYNRRVDRPNEVDIGIFPKYDDAEIIKVGNPALNPQFTNLFELGYKRTWGKGYFYSAAYQRRANGTITRIASTVPGSTLIYSIMQNAAKSSNTGLEIIVAHELKSWFSFNMNLNGYQSIIDAFSVENKYPAANTFSAASQSIFSYNAKFNGIFHFKNKWDAQLSAVYLAPDIIPQGKIDARFSLDIGVKKQLQKGKGEIFVNATDLLNTMQIRKNVQGTNFRYYSADYYETQVIRIGYSYKF